VLAASRFCCVRFFGGEAQICVLVHLVCIVLPHYLVGGVGVCGSGSHLYAGPVVYLFVFLSAVVASCIITDENNICYFKKKKVKICTMSILLIVVILCCINTFYFGL